jgi:hypothetical protein
MEFLPNDPQNMPDETRPAHLNVRDKVIKYLESSDDLGGTIQQFIGDELVTDTARILYDAEDDKLGRINDLFNVAIGKVADYIEKAYTVDSLAFVIYSESIKDI